MSFRDDHDAALEQNCVLEANAAHMDPTRNTSPSFQTLRDALAEMAA